jgi:hypothetical protein
MPVQERQFRVESVLICLREFLKISDVIELAKEL